MGLRLSLYNSKACKTITLYLPVSYWHWAEAWEGLGLGEAKTGKTEPTA